MRALEVKPPLPTRYVKIGKRLKMLYAQKSGAERSDWGKQSVTDDRQHEVMGWHSVQRKSCVRGGNMGYQLPLSLMLCK